MRIVVSMRTSRGFPCMSHDSMAYYLLQFLSVPFNCMQLLSTYVYYQQYITQHNQRPCKRGDMKHWPSPQVMRHVGRVLLVKLDSLLHHTGQIMHVHAPHRTCNIHIYRGTEYCTLHIWTRLSHDVTQPPVSGLEYTLYEHRHSLGIILRHK